MHPSYDAVMEAVGACGMSVMVELTAHDTSYLYDVGEQLRLAPIERLRRLGGPARVRSVERLTNLEDDAIVIGDTAGALQGWPLILPGDGPVDVCASDAARDRIGGLDGVRVVRLPAGTRGYADLRRDREQLDVGPTQIAVAAPLDLVRIERCRGNVVQAGALEALLEYRRRWPAGPPPRRKYNDAEARSSIDAWLARQ
jgi:hypothetical protein